MSIGLYEHQRQAVDSLRSGSILCGGVGTGKSRTALAFYYERICGGRLEERHRSGLDRRRDVKLIIITTARKRDLGEWTLEMSVMGISDKCGDYVVDSWNNIQKYANETDAFFIFDEQRLIGKGAWVKAFLKIAKRNRWIILSATPGDTWIDYVPVFIANGFYRNRTEFNRLHVRFAPNAKFPKILGYFDEDRLRRLRDSITVHMEFSRAAVRHDIWIPAPYDQESYDLVLKRHWDPLEGIPVTNLARYCYLQRYFSNNSTGRVGILEGIVKKHFRVIVFYNFDYELDILRDACRKWGVPFSEWNGHKHELIPDTERWVYLVQYAAGAEGWNCTTTDTIVFYSLNYSYKTIKQARGRIDRMNSPYSDLYYFYLYSKSLIDMQIRKALKNKKTFNEQAFLHASKTRSIMEGIG